MHCFQSLYSVQVYLCYYEIRLIGDPCKYLDFYRRYYIFNWYLIFNRSTDIQFDSV